MSSLLNTTASHLEVVRKIKILASQTKTRCGFAILNKKKTKTILILSATGNCSPSSATLSTDTPVNSLQKEEKEETDGGGEGW